MKKAKKKAPEQSGPVAENKQRLLLLSRAEKLAAVTGGAVDNQIPDDLIRRRLQGEAGHIFDIEPILAIIARHAGYCRGFYVPGVRGPIAPRRMEPAAVVRQAEATCAVIDELSERLANMHPDIDCWADDALMRSRGEFLHLLRDRIQPDLSRLRAAIKHAGQTIAAQPVRSGPKQSEWTMARDAIATALQVHSQPPMAVKAAKPLAVEILEYCGLMSPRKPRR